MQIKNYQPIHKEAVLALLRMNTPAYFAPEEEADFIHYLEHEIDEYFVIEYEPLLVGTPGQRQSEVQEPLLVETPGQRQEESQEPLLVETPGQRQIVGCGGINFKDDGKTGVLSWDMINPNVQGQGIGSQLVRFRVERLFDKYRVEQVIVRTTQLVYPFYEKMGFRVVMTEKDFWAKGYDLYYMVMRRSE